jgi:hypothetical protein
MPPLSYARAPAPRLILAAAALTLALAGMACTTGKKNPPGKPQCPEGQLYDSPKGSCIKPATETEARDLVTRGELEDLRDHGDFLVLADINLRFPCSRSDFQTLLAESSPVEVTIIDYFFQDIGGGFDVPVSTAGVAPSASDLLTKSKLLVTARFSGSPDPTLNTYAAQFAQAFELGREQYMSIEVRAKPSVLLSALARDSKISHIAVVNPAVQP